MRNYAKKNAHKGKTAYRTSSVFRYNKILKDVRMNKHPKKQKKNK